MAKQYKKDTVMSDGTYTSRAVANNKQRPAKASYRSHKEHPTARKHYNEFFGSIFDDAA